MDRPNLAHGNEQERNIRLQKRASFTYEGATDDIISRLLPRSIHVKWGQCQSSTVRNKDSFYFMSGEANTSCKVKFMSAILLVRKVLLSPSVVLAHFLRSSLDWLSIRRIVCKTYIIPAGNLNGNHEKLFIEQLSSRLVIECVNNDAFNPKLYEESLQH